MERDFSHYLDKLLALPRENEVVEFKEAKASFDSDKLGQYFSALSNEANLQGADEAWLVFGVTDKKEIVGTAFRQDGNKLQNLLREVAEQTSNRLTFRGIHEVQRDGQRVLLFEIPPAVIGIPTAWKGHCYGRDGESLGPLNPDERRRIERQSSEYEFDREIAWENAGPSHVRELIDYEAFYRLFKLPLPSGLPGVLEKFLQERIIVRASDGKYNITNLGALLFARDLRQFTRIAHKAPRVIFYEGTGRTSAKREQSGQKGYAFGFEGIVTYLHEKLPANEELQKVRRETVPIYPILALRELVANALIHQDLTIRGTAPMIEVFSNRIEITNPGSPLIDTLRFIDHAPRSRNEAVAAMMRRLGFCEERGSGIDLVVEECEKYQLPAPNFINSDNYTRAILYSPRSLRLMDKPDKIRACYQHACLKHENGEQMTNQSFRERMGIEEKNYSIVSRIIADTIEKGLIKPYDPDNKSKKHIRYVPIWA
ncbi:ATP-binding protein [Hymenobacter algoricola]|uniref:Helix-turn-helix domain-containing protein n=1 Tax=Hymenobacter algoricola TaxID=486267 RepID=A0ABP7MBF6_9BACT